MEKSLYELGAEAVFADKELGSIGPAQILREFRALHAKISQLNGVVIGSVESELEEVRIKWASFYQSWKDFFDTRQYAYTHANEEQLPSVLENDLVKIREFESKANAWAQALAKVGLTVSAFDEKKESLGFGTKVFIGIGALIVLGIVAKEVGKSVGSSVSKHLE